MSQISHNERRAYPINVIKDWFLNQKFIGYKTKVLRAVLFLFEKNKIKHVYQTKGYHITYKAID